MSPKPGGREPGGREGVAMEGGGGAWVRDMAPATALRACKSAAATWCEEGAAGGNFRIGAATKPVVPLHLLRTSLQPIFKASLTPLPQYITKVPAFEQHIS